MLARIDLLTVLIIFFAGLVAIGLSAWMLNRAWGNFPGRAGLPPTAQSPARSPLPTEQAAWSLDSGAEGDRPLPAGASSDNLVEVTHPLVLQALRRALERPGSPYATYFIDEGDRVFLVLSRIADPAQRETARRLFEGLDGASMGNVGLGDLMQLLNQLGKR